MKTPGTPRIGFALLLALGAVLATARSVDAQDPPPPIPFFVIDLHATTTNFPPDPILAASRDVALAELPGRGLGGDAAIHIHPFRLRAVTFGFGGRLTLSRASRDAGPQTGAATLRPVSERFTYLGPQLSLNFGTGTGWSYLSGGIAASTWSVAADGVAPAAGNDERLKTIDYGGGARWFAKPHLAFSFDVRFYAINPGTALAGRPGSPRKTLVVIGAGISIK